MANVRVTELDFDTIKSNLKEFLRSQSAFTDYDFDASNLSVLLDLLAYNTHYTAILANMVSNWAIISLEVLNSLGIGQIFNLVEMMVASAWGVGL